MNLHEYQAKDLFREAGIPVPPGEVVETPEDAERVAMQLGPTVVVKAQVHSGGRGKAGGVKLASSPAEAREHAARILGMEIRGITVRKVLVTSAEEIEKEAYVAVLIDRSRKAPVFMVSAEGGVDIEEVAHSRPGAIRKVHVDPRYGLLRHQAYAIADFLYDDPDVAKQASEIVSRLYDAFVVRSCSLAEIQPPHRDARGEGEGHRRQGHDRRQRPLPSSRHRGLPGTRRPSRPPSERPGRPGSRS